MTTKLTITIDGTEHVVQEENGRQCLKNWDDVKCAYKRSDYSGVVRSFTSQFEFVGFAYEILLEEFLKNRYEGQATLTFYGQNNTWGWDKLFSCPLDFSTFKRERKVISINALDNSLTAIIKANKSTDYELNIGSDIIADGIFRFDRLPMIESVTYEFTQGESQDDGSILISHTGGKPVWLGSVGDEICIGGTMYWLDDQEDEEGSYLLRAVKACTVKLEATWATAYYKTPGGTPVNGYWTSDQISSLQLASLSLTLRITDSSGSLKRSDSPGNVGPVKIYVGEFSSESALYEQYPLGHAEWDTAKLMASVNGKVYDYSYNPRNGLSSPYYWKETDEMLTDRAQRVVKFTGSYELAVGDKISIISGSTITNLLVKTSAFKFSWEATGDTIEVDAFTPGQVLRALGAKLFDGTFNVQPIISTFDSRLSQTLVLAAESIRGISGAQLTLSFSKFCDWMEAVFGYTYYIGEQYSSPLTGPTQIVGSFTEIPYPDSGYYPGTSIDATKIRYNTKTGKFYLADNGYYYSWKGYNNWVHPSTGGPWTNRLYQIAGKYYYFKMNDDGTTVDPTPIEYPYSAESAGLPFQEICFVHRSEIFRDDAEVKVITEAMEGVQSADSSQVFSTVEIGYDKKDYDSVNGRDEFNFNNTYSTGSTVSDKKLSLISKFRADCYGMEFAAQKRGEDTTDSDSDTDVFFVYCSKSGTTYTPYRGTSITGALSDKVFNGVFCPMRCVQANEGYIGMQADPLTLAFASSKGNSSIVVANKAMSGDLTLNNPLFRADTFEFTTNDLDVPEDLDCLVQVDYDGLRYTGYISQLEVQYAKPQAAKYTLIVKTIEICS